MQAFASGLLSALGHSPTFRVADFAGTTRLEDPERSEHGLDLSVQADSLALMDHVSASDHREIEQRMKRDVLEVAVPPRDRLPRPMSNRPAPGLPPGVYPDPNRMALFRFTASRGRRRLDVGAAGDYAACG